MCFLFERRRRSVGRMEPGSVVELAMSIAFRRRANCAAAIAHEINQPLARLWPIPKCGSCSSRRSDLGENEGDSCRLSGVTIEGPAKSFGACAALSARIPFKGGVRHERCRCRTVEFLSAQARSREIPCESCDGMPTDNRRVIRSSCNRSVQSDINAMMPFWLRPGAKRAVTVTTFKTSVCRGLCSRNGDQACPGNRDKDI